MPTESDARRKKFPKKSAKSTKHQVSTLVSSPKKGISKHSHDHFTTATQHLPEEEEEEEAPIDPSSGQPSYEELLVKIKKQNEQLQKQQAQLQKQKEQLGEGLLLLKGLPPLGKHNCSTNQTPNYGVHDAYSKEVQPTPGTFAILDGYKLECLPLNVQSLIWKRVQGNSLGLWNHESHIQNFVSDVIVDVIELAGLGGDIQVYMEAQLNVTEHLRADIVIFRKHGVIIGVCEVKKPSIIANDLENDMLRIQISNYMQHIKFAHGLKAVFGIVTTYNEWKFCWLEDAKIIAESSEETSTLFVSSEVKTKEILYESQTFVRDDPRLVEALVSLIRKMVNCPIDPPTKLIRDLNSAACHNERKFGLVDADSFVWATLPLNLRRFSFRCSNKNTSRYYLLEDFHGGADGRVWLYSSRSGKIGVMKLNATSNFTHEMEVWRNVWKVPFVRVERILNCHALLMPYAFHGGFVNGKIVFRPFGFWKRDEFTLSDYNSPEVEEMFDLDCIKKYTENPFLAAQEALQGLVAAGYVHKDVHWRHVALLPQPSKKKKKWSVCPILIDCSTVVTASGDELKNFEQTALNLLRTELDVLSQTDCSGVIPSSK